MMNEELAMQMVLSQARCLRTQLRMGEGAEQDVRRTLWGDDVFVFCKDNNFK